MESQIKKLPKSQVQATIKVDQKEFEQLKNKALEKLAQNAKLPGFRKGKVPAEMIKDKIGEHAVLAEILDSNLPKWYQEICVENKLQPVSDVEPEIVKTDPLEIKITFGVWPEVTLADPAKVKVKKQEIKVSDAEVQKEIDAILEQNVEWREVERAARNGDKVEIDFEGFDESGAPMPNAKSEKHPLILGSNMMIPGFEEQIAGMKPGAEKEFEIAFPADYHAESMKGKKAKFKIKLHHVFEKSTPKFDDAFVEKFTQGKFKKADELKKEIRKVLQEHHEKMGQQKYEADVIAQFAEKCKLDVPESLVRSVQEQMLSNFKQDIMQRGMQWEQYLEHHKISEDDIKNKWRDNAEKRAREEICLQQFADAEKIQMSEKEVDEEVARIVAGAPEQQRSEVEKYYAQPRVRAGVNSGIRMRKAIDGVIKRAEGK